jgi:two-component system response regulator AtoC
VRGAFTGATADRAGLFEDANGGTLLLDEIGDLPLALQAKLLRVLEEGEIRRVGEGKSRPVDVRLLAATARKLDAARAAGHFRDDLYYRLNVVELVVPPLRERQEDIPALLTHFAQHAAQRLGHPVSLSPAALAFLSHYAWPQRARAAQCGRTRGGPRHRASPERRISADPRPSATGPATVRSRAARQTSPSRRAEALERDQRQALESGGAAAGRRSCSG